MHAMTSLPGIIHKNSLPKGKYLREDEIRRHIEQLLQEGEEWRSIKLIVLGNGRIGKTTLLHTFDRIKVYFLSIKVEQTLQKGDFNCVKIGA